MYTLKKRIWRELTLVHFNCYYWDKPPKSHCVYFKCITFGNNAVILNDKCDQIPTQILNVNKWFKLCTSETMCIYVS